jgi:hypothetical protein
LDAIAPSRFVLDKPLKNKGIFSLSVEPYFWIGLAGAAIVDLPYPPFTQNKQ